MGGVEPVFPVGFDDVALAEDLARLSEGGVRALVELQAEIERTGGLPSGRLMSCEAEGRDGTRLAGCVKTYVPWPGGRFGAVFIAMGDSGRGLMLRAIAFGVRHQPRDTHALSVYQVADRRLNV